MTTLLTRLAFGLWIVGASFTLVGCGDEGAKPAASPAAPAPAAGDAGKPAPAAPGK